MINLQFIRKDIQKDTLIKNFIKNQHTEQKKIIFSNVWFIVIPKKSKYIYKYYFSNDFISYLWLPQTTRFNFFEKEKKIIYISKINDF